MYPNVLHMWTVEMLGCRLIVVATVVFIALLSLTALLYVELFAFSLIFFESRGGAAANSVSTGSSSQSDSHQKLIKQLIS